MNPKNFELNSKWTSLEPRLGWRHFRIVMRRYEGEPGQLQIELMAACDREARLWVAATELKDDHLFVPGWLGKDSL